MICSVFVYDVDPAQHEEFERVYGPDGEWARFFRGFDGYLGTELLGNGGEYLLIDRWDSGAAYDAVLAADEYARRSVEAERLYRAERILGRFAPVR